MIKEKSLRSASGYGMLFALIFFLLIGALMLVRGIIEQNVPLIVIAVLILIADPILMGGLFVVNPNESRVVQLFGKYVGTVKQPGLRWVNPFTTRRKVSVRVRNFESGKLKVNDRDGNPIEIAAVVVWRVVDTAEAVFEVDDYVNFVEVQSEAAVRNLTTSYPYDAHEENETALRSHTGQIADHLKREIQERLDKAGVEVIEARISHLAYAPEIASAMLQRQQASAIIAARQKIVEGAVGMVQMALEQLAKGKIVDLDEERKAAMVGNLLVVLCGDRDPHPVINAGSLYH